MEFEIKEGPKGPQAENVVLKSWRSSTNKNFQFLPVLPGGIFLQTQKYLIARPHESRLPQLLIIKLVI